MSRHAKISLGIQLAAWFAAVGWYVWYLGGPHANRQILWAVVPLFMWGSRLRGKVEGMIWRESKAPRSPER